VDKIISLDPDNVTVHSFCVKNAAQVRSDNKEIYKDTDDTATKCVDYSVKALTENGYIPYYMYRQKNTVNNLENVGYAKADSFGLYNVFMMSDAHTVFGVGAGSTTKLVKNVRGEAEILRIFSPKYPYEYLQETKEVKDTVKNFFERS
jgi:oxygen-independent coproporphyrinogen-3 oxidase